MTVTYNPDNEPMLTRSFELFDIVWDRGSRWTNYDTAAEAQAVIDGCPNGGRVERREFTSTIPVRLAFMFRPGLAGTDIVTGGAR